MKKIILALTLFAISGALVYAGGGSGKPNPPIIEAIIHGDYARVESYLNKGGNPNQTDSYGDSLLWLAITYGQNDIAVFLINNKADIYLCSPNN